MPSSRRSSQPRDRTRASCVSCIVSGFSTHWAIREALCVFVCVYTYRYTYTHRYACLCICIYISNIITNKNLESRTTGGSSITTIWPHFSRWYISLSLLTFCTPRNSLLDVHVKPAQIWPKKIEEDILYWFQKSVSGKCSIFSFLWIYEALV